MEQFIILIIITALSAIVNVSKKRKEHSETDPSFEKPTVDDQQNDGKRPYYKEVLSELEREFKEMKKDFQEVDQEPPSRQKPTFDDVKPMVKEIDSNFSTESLSKSTPKETETLTGRLSHHKEKQPEKIVHKTKEHFMPQNEQDVVKGIIFAEIFGPPKAKR